MGLRLNRFLICSSVLAVAGCPDKGGGDGAADTETSGDDTTGAVTTGPVTTGPATDDTTGDETTTGEDTTTGVAAESSSSGAESSSSGGEGLPDIDMDAVLDVITESAYTQTVTFGEDSCALEEMCVDAAGERRLLRFDTWTPNLGDADLVVGNPTDNPELFEYAACHEHFHFLDFANYRLIDAKGAVVATGHKQSFALIDFEQFVPGSGPGQYPLPDGTQGISMGWADIYGAYLDCQWVDITGVEPGEYTLEIDVNPEEHLLESSYDNNIALVPVTIGMEDDVPPILPPPKEWTCPDGYYGTGDGCDCGCGAVDPDCPNPTAGACEYCDGPGACSTTCADINATNNAICD